MLMCILTHVKILRPVGVVSEYNLFCGLRMSKRNV